MLLDIFQGEKSKYLTLIAVFVLNVTYGLVWSAVTISKVLRNSNESKDVRRQTDLNYITSEFFIHLNFGIITIAV
jgi:preprotein translocase subunit Sec63